jgi:DHA2 family multidrug resistance protein-like MFS transporter
VIEHMTRGRTGITRDFHTSRGDFADIEISMEHVRTVGEAPKASRREWVGLAVIALPCMLYSMDLTVLNLAVPRLSADLRPSSAQLLWIIDIYGFLLAGSLITMGTLGDRIGRRRLLLIGAAAFGVASVFAALSTSAEMLIAARALLGVAGATLAPSTLSLIRHMFVEPNQRTAAIGVWVSSYSIGGAIGPVIGGILLEHYWWGSVFLVGVPVMVLLLILGPLLLPEFRAPNAGRLDLFSAALSLASVLAVIYGLKRMAEDGVTWRPVLSTAIGVVIGIIFVRRQRKLVDPLIDLRLFRARAFSASLTTYMIGTLIGFGAFVFVAQYLQLVLGLSPLQAGLWMVPWPLAFVAGSMLTPMIVRRVRVAFVVSAGLVVSAVGFALLTWVEGVSGLAVVVIGSAVMSLGLAPVFILATDLIVGAASPEQAGAASALSETSSEFGGALGIAVLGSIGTAVYRHKLADTIPNGVSTDAVALASDTLGGAVVAAAQLAEPLGPLLLSAAREAFTHAFQIAAGVSAATAMATAIVAAIALRHVGASQAETSM